MSSLFLGASLGAYSEGANLRSYFCSLPIRYELILPVSHRTRTHPSVPTSFITVPSPGGGPSCRRENTLLYSRESLSKNKDVR